jgi:hypothetical protein
MLKQEMEKDERDSRNKEKGIVIRIAGAFYVWRANV